MGAHELVEAGRQHVATGRIREAMACFKRAADDPVRFGPGRLFDAVLARLGP